MRAFLSRLVLALSLLWPGLTLAQTSTTTTEATTTETPAAAPAGHLEVSVGAYILRMSNVSPQTGSYDVDMWLWFRWKGGDLKPYESFEIVNGVISSRSEPQVQEDDGMQYATVRVQATVFHDFDVRRFPLDNHVLPIIIEDGVSIDRDLSYVADEGTAIDPSVEVAGWKVAMQTPGIEVHKYATNYGLRSAGDAASDYSRLTFYVALDRTSWAPLFKSFWISALSVLLGLLAFLIKADDLDARFGMGVGSIFAASANTFVITGSLPPTTAVTLAEQINLIAVAIIFIAVFVSIWSLRLRYRDMEEASLALDRRAMWVLGSIYVALNILVMAVDLNGLAG
ncbi:hypothetical protein [Stagnihabitans tardus]|uniref:Neurotransmitter-gated ion-channel ligand-binding domain-containing protein n=1 Tax=Stagnihabitans tardus TaxID=2699202 RepID=A0AAE5BW24_9RHOB|nr:hypothetical protein [Stagnihabitans tardus]NBZ88807.1 hypothetical protein [Stagnihabitans tardus]